MIQNKNLFEKIIFNLFFKNFSGILIDFINNEDEAGIFIENKKIIIKWLIHNNEITCFQFFETVNNYLYKNEAKSKLSSLKNKIDDKEIEFVEDSFSLINILEKKNGKSYCL